MARFQRSKQAFKVRNQVDLMCIALQRNNLTWIDHGYITDTCTDTMWIDHGYPLICVFIS